MELKKYIQYHDSRETIHTFALLYDIEKQESFFRYRWHKTDGTMRGDYGERNYHIWAFQDFEDFIQITKRDFDIQDIIEWTMVQNKFEDFLSIEDMQI